MCLAIPMQVIEIRGTSGDALQPPSALVVAEGVQQEVRLDIVDRLPAVGDYVIVHAGFALHSLRPAAAVVMSSAAVAVRLIAAILAVPVPRGIL